MIKSLAFRLIRGRLKNTLPLLNNKLYNKMFTISYRFFLSLKASEILVIVLGLLNKMGLKSLLNIPSMFILFSSIFSDSDVLFPNADSLYLRLEANKLTGEGNNLDAFLWVVIGIALVQRFINTFFKLLWLPFKIALYYWILKYLGFYLTYVYNVLNTLSLGIIDWFYKKITSFIEYVNNNDNNI